MMIAKAEIDRLSVAEKIQLVEDIWDSLVADPAQIPVAEAEKRELDRRWSEHMADANTALSLDDFQRRLKEKL